MTTISRSSTTLLQVGLVGTGYAARLRAEALQSASQAALVAVAGHTLEKTQEFSQTYGAEAVPSWMELVQRSDLDLIIVANVNRDHAAIVRAALEAGKHVVVEYPLALAVGEAAALIDLARSQHQLLHVEHIELLGGMHQALKAALPQVGAVFYARYATINPQRPAPQKWTYHPDLFGFPLMGALSRLHRLTDLFGVVKTVSCQARFWDAAASGHPGPYYAACLCQAQLQFESGLLADVCYGKGETLWQAERLFQVHGEAGALIMNGDEGMLVLPDRSEPIAVGTRRGLFGKDTAIVLDHLTTGAPLYVQPEASLYTLKVADAARRSAQSGQTIAV
jgi:biliverdin reductase